VTITQHFGEGVTAIKKKAGKVPQEKADYLLIGTQEDW